MYLDEEAVKAYDHSVKKYRRKVLAKSGCLLCAVAAFLVMINDYSESRNVKETEEILAAFFNDGPDVEESLSELLNQNGI